MAANPLFYRKIVPLDRGTHRTLTLKPPEKPLNYAREAHFIPAVIDEFAAAAGEIPIAFLPGAPQPAAVFVTGLKPGANAFVTEAGRWNGSYLPAYLRRYPFIIGEVTGAEPILCIDEAFEGFGQQDGTPLFSPAGKPEPQVAEALKLANDYWTAATRTDEMARLLQRLSLFRSVSLDAKLQDGQTLVVHGLLVVDEQALANLSDDNYVELRHAGFLKAIYAHLFSLSTITKLAEKWGKVASRAEEAAK